MQATFRRRTRFEGTRATLRAFGLGALTLIGVHRH
jgi:hypothetical protein